MAGGCWYPTSASLLVWSFDVVSRRRIIKLLCVRMYPNSRISKHVMTLLDAQFLILPVVRRHNDDTGQACRVEHGFEKFCLFEQVHKRNDSLGITLQNAVNT